MNFQHLRRAALPLIGCLSLAAAMPLSAQKAVCQKALNTLQGKDFLPLPWRFHKPLQLRKQ